MCRTVIIHNITDLYGRRNGPAHFRACKGSALASFAWPGSDLMRRPRAKPRRGASTTALKIYETLTSGCPIRNRKLTRVGAKNRASKESIMLDVAFVVLGLAVLALMGVYAVGLRQL
jgi:hypothetical protein